MKIEMYYEKEMDSVDLVIDGKLAIHDEGIGSTEFLWSFGNDENVNTVEDLNKFDPEFILERFFYETSDFRIFATKDEFEEYFGYIDSTEPSGEVFYSKEFEPTELSLEYLSTINSRTRKSV